jgi:hypothetical protein
MVAIETYRSVLRLSPGRGGASYGLGSSLMAAGRLQEVLSVMERSSTGFV